MFIASNCNLRF